MKLKKTISLFAGAMLAISSVSANFCTFAEGESNIISGDYVYSIAEDGTACLEEYRGEATDIVIPETIDGIEVTLLGNDTYNNTGVTTITFNDNITGIGENTFTDCFALTEFIVDESNTSFEAVDGVLFTEDMKFIVSYPVCKEGTEYTIPDTVETIGTAAFYATSLQKLDIPDGLSSIYRHGICYNPQLKSLDFSKTKLSAIDDMAFAYCDSLSEVLLPDSLAYIGNATFAGCSSLAEITLPESLVEVGQNAFAGTALTTVTIPMSVETIGYCAFGYDADLKAVDGFIIKGVSGSKAQSYCTESDSEYEYSNNFTFVDISEEEYSEYEELDQLEYGYFKYSVVDGEAYITSCDISVDAPEIPEEIDGYPVTRIYGGAFMQSNATKMVIPPSVKVIEIMAFYNCPLLKEVTLSEGLEEIMAEAFSGCTAVESITIPASCNSIGDNAFAGCTALKEINVAEGSSSFSSDGGILFNAAKDTLIKYPVGLTSTEYDVPDSVKTISAFAFMNAASLTEINLNKVSAIGADAFAYCTSLKSITIPDTVKEIVTKSNGTFEGCTALKNVELGDGVKTIGEYSFYGCSALEKVTFPKNLEVISGYAFYDCPKLKTVRLGSKITEINSVALGYVYDAENDADEKVDGFKIYADKDSGGDRYAQICELECVTDTYEILGVNISKSFVIVIISAVAVLIAAFIAILCVRAAKIKKKKKEEEELKRNAAEVIERLHTAAQELAAVQTSEEKTDNADGENGSDEQ